MTSIAIDGPAGAGKSTIARAVAGKLNFIYVDTGALYRAIGLFAAREGVDMHNEAALASRLAGARIELGYRDGGQRVFLCGEDVSDDIRSPEMSKAASVVSAHPSVRAFLLELQRDMAAHRDVVMDGRDIGTVVLPGADVKIYLTATPEARAQRRHEEYLAKGEPVSYEDILKDMKQRDYDDIHRDISPLRQADDAVLLETSENTVEESIDLVLRTLQKRGIG